MNPLLIALIVVIVLLLVLHQGHDYRNGGDEDWPPPR
jgi:hypothetical protein